MKRWLLFLIVIGGIWWLVYALNRPGKGLVLENVMTDFNKTIDKPVIDESAHVSSQATVIGNVSIGKNVYLGPHSFVRGDEGQSLFVGDDSNIQDGAGIHALETEEMEKEEVYKLKDNRLYTESGVLLSAEEAEKTNDKTYAVYIGKAVSIAHQSLVHGPAYVGDSTFVGMQSLIFNAKVGKNVAIGVKSLITNGVSIPDGSYIAPGSSITTQAQADALPSRIGSPYENTNAAVVHVNISLAHGYNGEKFEVEHKSADTTKTLEQNDSTNIPIENK